MFISAYCNTEFWSLSLDYLSGYIKALQAFLIWGSLCFDLGLIGSRLGFMIFDETSPRS